jgi:hypothetical protein
MDDATLAHLFREALRDRLANLPVMLPAIRHTRGIVTTAGGDLYFRLAWHLLTCLRGLGCRLPIEVWTLGDSEMDPVQRQLLEQWDGVTVVALDQYCQTHGITPRKPLGGWELKAFAMRHSGFAEAMFLDADNVPTSDPTYLFNDLSYQRRGAMFWPDLPPQRPRAEWIPEAAWAAVGISHQRVRPFESGQMLVNRQRCLQALDLAWFLNDWSDRMYQVVYGDKDCFLLAWHLLGQAYHMPARSPRWYSPAIHQHDSDGRVCFQHACGAKANLAAGRIVKSLVARRYSPDAAADLQRRTAEIGISGPSFLRRMD